MIQFLSMQRLNPDTPTFSLFDSACIVEVGRSPAVTMQAELLSCSTRPVGHMNHARLALMLEPVTLTGNRHDVGVMQ